MNAQQLTTLMKKYCIFEIDLDNICDFISAVLELKAKELEETEPYATHTMRCYRDAAQEVFNLTYEFGEILEEEN